MLLSCASILPWSALAGMCAAWQPQCSCITGAGLPHLGNPASSHLLSQVCLCRDLSSVAAPYSCVTDAGLSHLGNCASLRSVDVSFCTLITDRGLVALAAGLRTKLQRLLTFRVSMSQAASLWCLTFLTGWKGHV